MGLTQNRVMGLIQRDEIILNQHEYMDLNLPILMAMKQKDGS